ncbi:DUF3829 domain-containing protein [Luteimonas huabeiensis]|uniref:DUF3829 domain-containing protein n=1 Tax=Luteimonas huabeiensis TaxID=1244513 RepID=UPI0009DD64D8|nr:DUF3829 domain-containing protein [Luteimonas huabeiensis]
MRKNHGPALGLLPRAAVILLLSAGLAACGDKEAIGGQASATGQQQVEDTSAAAQSEGRKLAGYVAAFNELSNEYGLPYQAASYLRQDFSKATANSTLVFSVSNLDRPLENLKQARGIEGDGYQDLDAIADRLIADLDTLFAQHRELDVYYSSNAYKDDGVAKGKAADPTIRNAFESALAALDEFDAALEGHLDERRQAELEKLKGQGDKLPYYALLNIQLGQDLVGALVEQNASGEKMAFEATDDVAAQLQQAATDLKNEYLRQKETAGEGRAPAFAYEHLAGAMIDVLAYYRKLKQDGDADQIGGMVDAYNRGVASANEL